MPVFTSFQQNNVIGKIIGTLEQSPETAMEQIAALGKHVAQPSGASSILLGALVNAALEHENPAVAETVFAARLLGIPEEIGFENLRSSYFRHVKHGSAPFLAEYILRAVEGMLAKTGTLDEKSLGQATALFFEAGPALAVAGWMPGMSGHLDASCDTEVQSFYDYGQSADTRADRIRLIANALIDATIEALISRLNPELAPTASAENNLT